MSFALKEQACHPRLEPVRCFDCIVTHSAHDIPAAAPHARYRMMGGRMAANASLRCRRSYTLCLKPEPCAARSVAVGFDNGAVVIKIGHEVPAASTDSSGKITSAPHNEMQTVDVETLGNELNEARSLASVVPVIACLRIRRLTAATLVPLTTSIRMQAVVS